VSWPTTPQERHRAAATTFGDRVRGVGDWDAPTPVKEWRARDVVRHLLEWLPGFLESGAGVRLGEVAYDDDDLASSWETRAGEVQELLETRQDAVYTSRMFGDIPLTEAIDRFYVADVMMHTWDLARATGQDDRLDPEFCEQAFAGMEPMADVLAASDQYGPRVPVPDDADAQDRLIGLIGRDPGWRPPA
jgi:uncharacterized protein (TIGR03086 family)